MKEPKNVVVKDSVINRLAKVVSKGFSVIELMTAVAIGGVVSLGVSALFVFAIEQFTILVEQNKTEESLLWASYYLRAYMGQGINVRGQTTVGSGAALTPTDNGLVLITTPAAADDTFVGLGLFVRENGTANQSSLTPSGIFYLTPSTTANVGTAVQGGVLFFDTVSGVSGTVAPSIDSLWFDRISGIDISEVDCVDAVAGSCVGQPLKALTYRLRARYFRSSDRSQWDYSGTPTVAFRDLEMTIRIGFKNNELRSTSSLDSDATDRLHGGLYFFRMILPPLGARAL